MELEREKTARELSATVAVVAAAKKVRQTETEISSETYREIKRDSNSSSSSGRSKDI